MIGGVLGEIAFFVGLILLGVFTLALVIVTQVMMPRMGVELPPEAKRVLESELATGGGNYGRWIVAFVAVAAVGSGIAGLLLRLSQLAFSQERLLARSAAGPGAGTSDRKTADGHTAGGAVPKDSGFASLPTVPRRGSHAESPGERLQHRLESVSTGRWNLFGTVSLALIWNSVCLILLAVVVSGWMADRNRPILAMLLIPFFGIAWWSLRTFLRQVRQIVGVGPTLVEISEHPLEPGGRYEVYIAQMGRMKLQSLTITLVCEEESFFRQGTDVRAERHIAFSLELWSGKSIRVDPRRPWEQQLLLEVPANAMHSFSATHNSVRWRLTVNGESRPWPSFCRSFPLLVYPPLMASPAIPR
ncbi:MAG: hypothetical protein AAF670_21365 [Planctomycetota bacterium]